MLIISIVLMYTLAFLFGYKMFMVGLKAAISGFITGGLVSGLMNTLRGNSFLEGITEGAIYGAINGFSVSTIMFCVSQGISALTKALNTPKCFIAGTLVLTNVGYKKIEDIVVGDEVLSYNEETGETDYKEVVRLFRNTTKQWTLVEIDGENGSETITCTPGHKFYLPENKIKRDIGQEQEHAVYETLSEKWVRAIDLKTGDKVLLENGKYGIISNVTLQELDEPETTYNFEVEDFHTYYVGENGICTHYTGNCGGVIAPEGPQSISEVNFNVKNANYIAKRGWTMDIMDDAIHSGIKGTTTNLATNNMSYVYTASNGSYMVVDSVSYELVQLSKFGDMGWIPNPPIVWRK